MPWMIQKNEGEFCIYKQDANGQPMGETLGCHPNEGAAKRQLAALYANEPEAAKADARSVDLEELFYTCGDPVKALDDTGRVGGVLVRFTNSKDRDLDGEYFTAKTYLGAQEGNGAECTIHHGMPIAKGLEHLADHWLAPLKTERQDVALWAETVLNLSDEYENMVFEMVKQGKLGWSSSSAQHLVKISPEGEIQRWPIVEGALTPTPAEPRNRVASLKTLRETWAGVGKTDDPSRETGDNSKTNKRPKSETIGGAAMPRKLAVFAMGAKHYVYALDDEGKRVGDPLEAFDDAKKAAEWIEDEQAPEWLKAMRQYQEASDQRLVKILETITGPEAQRPSVGTAWAPVHATPEPRIIDPVTHKAFDARPWERVTTKTLAGKYSFHDFVMAVMRQDTATLKEMGSGYADFDRDKAGAVMDPVTGQVSKGMKVLGDQTGISGGFLVPPTFIPDLLRVEPESEVIWARCRRWPMATNSIFMPTLAMGGQTPGQTNFTGGVHGHWTETGTTKHEDEPEFGQVEITAHELSVYCEVKDALVQDSPISVTTIIQTLFGEALRYERDEACLDGTGVGMPWGIIDSPGTLVLARNTPGRVLWTDLTHMMAHLLPRSYAFSFWVANVLLWEELTKIQDPAGNYIWQPNAQEGVNHPLLGRPIIWTEKTPVLGTKGDIILVDARYYYGGDKQDVRLGMSEHFLFRQNRVAFRASLRAGGREAIEAPIFLKDGINQVSPFVELDTEAATT